MGNQAKIEAPYCGNAQNSWHWTIIPWGHLSPFWPLIPSITLANMENWKGPLKLKTDVIWSGWSRGQRVLELWYKLGPMLIRSLSWAPEQWILEIWKIGYINFRYLAKNRCNWVHLDVFWVVLDGSIVPWILIQIETHVDQRPLLGSRNEKPQLWPIWKIEYVNYRWKVT